MFWTDTNPNAPTIVLPGFGKLIESSAEIFAAQSIPVPVFLKRRINSWEFVGCYRVTRLSKEPATVSRESTRAGRGGKVSMVLFLEPVGCVKES
jgi:hypothetical protein